MHRKRTREVGLLIKSRHGSDRTILVDGCCCSLQLIQLKHDNLYASHKPTYRLAFMKTSEVSTPTEEYTGVAPRHEQTFSEWSLSNSRLLQLHSGRSKHSETALGAKISAYTLAVPGNQDKPFVKIMYCTHNHQQLFKEILRSVQ